MYSDNYLEIVLTAVGWDFYGKIVTMIYSLNLHLLPLIFVMFSNWRSSVTSGNARTGYQYEMHNNFFDVGIMMLVIMLFWLPNSATQFNAPEHIQTIQSVSKDPNSSDVFKSAQDSMGVSSASAIDIPPGWYILINGTKAIVNQLKEWLNFSPEVTAMLAVFNNMKIKDDKVRAESDMFYSQCYLPALQRYQNSTKPVPTLSAKDMSYIGNNVFVNTPGLYKACTQFDIDSGNCLGDPLTMPVATAKQYGIPTRFVDPTTITRDGRPLTFSSVPSCHQWWTGDFDQHYQAGTLVNQEPLKDKLYEQAMISASDQAALAAIGVNTGLPGNPDPSFFSNFTSWVGSFVPGNQSEAKDVVIKAMIKTDPLSLTADPDRSYEEPEGVMGFIKQWGQGMVDKAQDLVAGGGAAAYSVKLGIILEGLKPALQMIQAGLIFAVLLYLAIALPVGGFGAEAVIKFGMIILGVLMLDLIWHIADVLNEGLLRLLYPGAVVLTDLVSLGTEAFVFQIFLFVLYILLPIVFIKMMAEAGYRMADGISEMMTDFKTAGSTGAGLAKKGLKK